MLGWLKANPGEFNASVQKGGQVDRPAARRLRRLRLDAIDHPGAQGADRLHQGQQEDAGGGRAAPVRRRASRSPTLPFAAGATEPLTLNVPDAEKTLKPGKNTVRVEITGKNVFPYTLTWSYRTLQAGQRRRTAR